jgi:hypothetical protein
MQVDLVRPSDVQPGPAAVERLLDRAVTRGIISADQSMALTALALSADEGTVAPGRPATGIVVEVLGYLGAAVALVSGMLIGAQLWAELAAWSRVALLTVLTVVVIAAAAALAGRTGAVNRLAGFLWAVSVVGIAATVAVAGHEFAGLGDEDASLLALTAGTVAAVAIYLWRRSGLQQVVMFVGVVITPAMALVRIDESLGESVGFVVWAIGVAWLVATWGGFLPPASVGYVLGTLAAVVGPFAVVSLDLRVSLTFGLLTTVALLIAGVRQRRGAVAAARLLPRDEG